MEIAWRNSHGEEHLRVSVTMFAVTTITFIIFYAYTITEILSIFNILTTLSVFVSWAILAVIISYIIFIKKIKLRSVHTHSKNALLSGIIITTVLFVGFVALLTVPYNYDSMTYHLSRVMNWKQNQSVNYYATNITRQIFNSPLAEYLILQFELLVGIENTFNLVQTGAYVISIGTLYGIGKKLGLEKKVCYFACILFMMTPIVMVEATTTQNDLAACMWSLFGTYLLIDYITASRITLSKCWILKTILLATIFVMCYLTKGTACITLLPLILIMGITRIIRKDKFTHLIGHLLVGAGQIIITLLPSFYRNIQLYGSFLGLGNYSNVMVDTFHPKYIFINALKNITTHLTFNNLTCLNPLIERGMLHMASTLGVDINDPLITWMGQPFSIVPSYACDTAKTPMLITLSLLSIAVFIWGHRQLDKVQKTFYITSLLTWSMTFSLLKWQPWITRLTICVMAYMCISVGIVLNAIIRKHPKMVCILHILVLICVICTLPVAHSLLKTSRATMHSYGWFYSRHSNMDSYTQATDAIKNKGYESVGLKTGEDTWEYPLWRMLEQSNVSTIKHVLLEDKAIKILEDTSYIPDCILVIDLPAYDIYSVLNWAGHNYGCVAIYDNILLFEKDYIRNSTEYLPEDSNVFVEGFSAAEGNHIWMIDDQSLIRLKCIDTSGSQILVRIKYYIYGDEQLLRITTGEQIIFEEYIKKENTGYIDLEIPADILKGDILNLTFDHPDAVSPYETNGTPDMRRLSFAIVKIYIVSE